MKYTGKVRASRFDDGELPPLEDYPDWQAADTQNFTVRLWATSAQGALVHTCNFNQARATTLSLYGRVLRDITTEDEAEKLGLAVFLVPKRKVNND